jgi:hypothetical protein
MNRRLPDARACTDQSQYRHATVVTLALNSTYTFNEKKDNFLCSHYIGLQGLSKGQLYFTLFM